MQLIVSRYVLSFVLIHKIQGFHTSCSSPNAKIRALFRAGRVEDALKLFNNISYRDVFSWNSIISGFFLIGDTEEAKRVFLSMPIRNTVSWNMMITGSFRNELVQEAFDYFNKMPERNTESWNCVISWFMDRGRVEEAAMLFDEMPHRNVVSYTAMVNGYAKSGDIFRARALFDVMPRRSATSWVVLLRGYVEKGMLGDARRLFDEMPCKNVVAFTAMITGYCKDGNMEMAEVLFREIKNKDRVSWNAMIAGYVQNDRGEEAMKLHSKMARVGMRPDEGTLVPLLVGCAALSLLRLGLQFHTILVKHGLDSTLAPCNALISMYCRSGSLPDSVRAFRQIPDPSPVSWNSLISAFSFHGLHAQAAHLFRLMLSATSPPDSATFLALLSAAARSGRVAEGLYWFRVMARDHGISPGPSHYACLVSLLARAGMRAEAAQIISAFRGGTGVWGPLFWAGSDVELAAAVRKGRGGSGMYVALSNMYAAGGRWDEAERVRELMKVRGVEKVKGFSWVESSPVCVVGRKNLGHQ